MAQPVRSLGIILPSLLFGACVSLEDIQQRPAIYSTRFTGSHTTVAQCIRHRLGGRMRGDSLGEKYVIYNAVKSKSAQGLTHYAITVGKSGPDEGFAEWRIMTPATSGQGPRPAVSGLTYAALQEYWIPVEECAARAKGS